MHEHDDAHRRNFDALTWVQQLEAVKHLADSGVSDYGIAAATGWAVEMVRAALGERNARS